MEKTTRHIENSGYEIGVSNIVESSPYKDTLNVVVKNQSNVTITSGSYTTTGNFANISFTAVEGDTYTIEFYINNACKNTFFQVDNVFISYEEVIITQTVYALEETFDVASDWQATTSYSQITYPSGKMRVRNSSTVKRTIGAKKSFVTGEGLHEVSFDITSLPSPICSIIRPPIIRSNSDSTTTTSGIGGNATLNVVVKNQNSVTITSGSYTTTGNFTNINFTAVEGDTYTLEFYINNACENTFFQVDDVFVSYEEEVDVEVGRFIVSGGYRYGFNSMERDNEIKGKGNSYDFGARMYDPRVGRWLSIDPLASKYPSLSAYSFVANCPIKLIDPDGKEIIINYKDENGEIQSYKYGSDIEVPNSTFVKETIKALNEINSRPQVREDFDFLAKTEDYIIEIKQRNYTIARPQIVRGENDEGEVVCIVSKYQTLLFNEKLGLQEISTGKINLPFISLWHELGHILNAIKDPESFDERKSNVYNKGDEKEKWSDEEEEFNIENIEHRIIDSNKNEFKRTTHKEGDKSEVKIIFIESSESSTKQKTTSPANKPAPRH